MVAFLLSSCRAYDAYYTYQKVSYYSDKENYVNAVGTVTHIAYNEDTNVLYLEFSDLEPRFADNYFKIVGINVDLVYIRGIDEKIEIGDTINFIAAPRYFGDGYIMPIVGLTVDGEELLGFDEGYENLLDWLKE